MSSLECRCLADEAFKPPGVPGAYIMFLASARLTQMGSLGPLLTTAQLAAYVGSTTSHLAGRLARYRQSLAGMVGVEELWVAVVPTSSAGAALWCEAALIDGLCPPLNSTSWGSKIPGRHRANQQPGLVDALFGGRSWAREVTPIERARAHLQMYVRLSRIPADAPRWPPITSATSPEAPPVSPPARPALRLLGDRASP